MTSPQKLRMVRMNSLLWKGLLCLPAKLSGTAGAVWRQVWKQRHQLAGTGTKKSPVPMWVSGGECNPTADCRSSTVLPLYWCCLLWLQSLICGWAPVIDTIDCIDTLDQPVLSPDHASLHHHHQPEAHAKVTGSITTTILSPKQFW